MKITQSQKSKKFSISNLTVDKLSDLWFACWYAGMHGHAEEIERAIYDSVDPDEIMAEYDYGVSEYVYHIKANYYSFKVKYPHYVSHNLD